MYSLRELCGCLSQRLHRTKVHVLRIQQNDKIIRLKILTTRKSEIMHNQEAYINAKKKVETRMSFYTHLAVYVVVISLLTILNLTVAGDYFWVMWPMIGWGSGLIIHGLFSFVFDSESSLKERLIKKEMEKGRT